MGFLKKKQGWECHENQDGTKTCSRFDIDKNEKVGTGTDVTIGMDPKTCEPFLTGDVSILDDDDEDMSRIIKKMKSGCRRGLQ